MVESTPIKVKGKEPEEDRQHKAFELGKIEESYLNIAATTYFFDCEKEEAFEKCVKGLVKAFDKNVEKTLACMITTVKMCL